MSADEDALRIDILEAALQVRQDGDEPTVERLKDAFPGHERLLADVLAELADPAGQPFEARRLGRFRLEELLGSGGQGEVYAAVDERLGRPVALKVLSRRLDLLDRDGGRQARARFAREAELVARLDHPGVCTVFDAGIDDDLPWIAMPRLDGTSLRDAIDGARRAEQPPPRGEELRGLVEIVAAIACALEASHAVGLVHRDVKPGNIMVTAEGQAVLLDFGLAIDGNAEDATLTATGASLGTPAYMAPEQIRGERERVGRSTDVYALGVTSFEAFTRRRPFEAASREALFREILAGRAPDVRRLNPAVSRDLAVVVATALDVEPERRYRSAAAMAEDLERVLAGREIAARPVGVVVRAARWARRNPAVAVLLSVLFVVISSAAVRSAMQTRRLTRLNAELDAALGSYESLADARRIVRAREEAAQLWPITESLVPELESWQRRHAPLAARLDRHREALDSLRRERGRPVASDEGHAFASAEDELRHELLSRLVADLEDFAESATGTVESVARRLDAARRIRIETVEAHRERWAGVSRRLGMTAIEGLPRDVPPTSGLIPLGPDPVSGLEEFLHWGTHDFAAQPLPLRGEDGVIDVSEATGVILVLLPGGRFFMGAQNADPEAPGFDPLAENVNESPVHEVAIDSFLMAKHEMTQGQWARLTGANPSQFSAGFQAPGVTALPVDARHPVEQVDWSEAMTMLRRAGLELPTEARWEFAARGPDGDTWAGTSDMAELSDFANVAGEESAAWFKPASAGHRDDHVIHAPVGSYEANPFGVFDLAGNVWEWCLDGLAGADVVPRGGDGLRASDSPRRTVRGGAFRYLAEDARAAGRFHLEAASREGYIGVRAVRSLGAAISREEERSGSPARKPERRAPR